MGTPDIVVDVVQAHQALTSALNSIRLMDSQKQTTLAVGLIMVIFLGWFFYTSQQAPKPPVKKTADTSQVASKIDTATHASGTATPAQVASGTTGTPATQTTSDVFRSATPAPAAEKLVETPLFTAKVSSKGGALSSFVLKNYLTWDKKPLDLVNQQDYHGGDVDLKFVASDGKTVSTNDLPFVLDPASVKLGEKDSVTFSALFRLDSGRAIEKIFRFSGDKYLIGVQYRLSGMQNTVSGYHYTASLDNPLPFAEKKSSDEATNAKAFIGIAGDIEELSIHKAGEANKKAVNGDITYVGSRTTYFVQSLIPVGVKGSGAEMSGRAAAAPDGGAIAKYEEGMHLPISRLDNESLNFNLYLGPLDYDRVAALNVGLESSMNFGWSFLVRPISIHVLRPLFMWLHSFISNWGIVILVFSILIKLVTMPLSTGQMRSMRKMQVLQPKVTELREKYKDEPQKMNEELLKLYRTYGVNPAGGCLPMLLQMPILFALYSVLRNVIQLRQAPFGLWIHDLSVPDALFHFGTNVPLIGEQLSGLTLLLVITMFVQQYFTVTDPRQKSMAYIMPIIFIFMFNNLPSGVGLYYFMFNIFGLVQQFYLTKIATPMTLDQMKVDPKKASGGLMGKLQEMEKQQRAARQGQYAGKSPSSKKGNK